MFMNFSIKLKDPDQYVFSDGHNVWASINYEKGKLEDFGNAKIDIQSEMFEITEEELIKKLTLQTLLSLFDKEKKLLSKATILPKGDARGTMLEYNGKIYKFTTKNNFTKFFPVYNWEDTNSQNIMSFKKVKAFPVMQEVSVETSLDFKAKETLLLALWGFYLMPKSRDKKTSIAVIIFYIIAISIIIFNFISKFDLF